MKKILQIVIPIFIFTVALLTGKTAEATVGGPTFVYSFKYNPQDESVYFTEISLSGRGCPPELKKVSLNTGEVGTVYSCDEGERLVMQGENYDYSLVEDRIRELTAGFRDLSQINLRDNRISVDIEYLRDEYLEGSPDFLMLRDFRATIFQNGKKLSEYDLTGCALNQPFSFDGYSIPGFEKKIIMLVSATEDCFEGGYIGEELLVLGDLENIDKSYTTNYQKDDSPLVISEATLVATDGEVRPEENVNETGPSTEIPNTETEEVSGVETKNTFPLLVVTIISLVALLLGFLLRGLFLKAK